MASIFFSYSHRDETLRNELETHLAMLKHEGLITSWHDRKILAGDELSGVIDAKLNSAEIILLLISPDFLASPYCYDIEVRQAMERHNESEARVIPVILRPCDWTNAPFGKLLAAPCDGKPVTKWPDRDEAFLDVVKQIRAALPESAKHQLHQAAPLHVPVETNITRSSNLRLRKHFTEADQDRFLDECFEFMAKYFEGSLNELQKRHPEIEGRFKRLDAVSFSAVIYRKGKSAARCFIRCGGRSGFGEGITYSHEESRHGSSYNESLRVVVGEQSLSLQPMGMNFLSHQQRDKHLTDEGAAEYYWSMLIEPLQR